MKILKILGIIGAVILIAIAGLLGYVKWGLPNVPVPDNYEVELTKDRIDRGEYLANHVMACTSCHSHRNKSIFAQPLKEGTLGMGGKLFGEEMGLPGNYYAANITPAYLDNYSDGELFRALACGVTKQGRAMFPIMPYTHYATADPEDIKNVIAYLRSLEPIENEVPASSSNFPMNFIINMIPQEAKTTSHPEPSDQIAYGAYLYNIASCGSCHTPIDEEGQPNDSLKHAGGFELPVPGGICRSANITPHKTTGIGKWSEEQFIQKFKQYVDTSYVPKEVPVGEFNTEMPWTWYAGMKEQDLAAIYAYLMSQEPIEHEVEKFTSVK